MYGAMPTRSRYFIAMASASSRLRFKTDTWPVMQLLSAVMLLNRLKLWNHADLGSVLRKIYVVSGDILAVIQDLA